MDLMVALLTEPPDLQGLGVVEVMGLQLALLTADLAAIGLCDQALGCGMAGFATGFVNCSAMVQGFVSHGNLLK